jgi:hypothetical protein
LTPRCIIALLLSALPLAACNIPPAHSELYPPDEAGLSQNFIITHDRYHPWQFQPIESMDGSH